MKTIAVICVLCLGVGAGFWWFTERAHNSGIALQVAYGEPTGTHINMDVIITAAMAAADPPSDTRSGGAWRGWVDKHMVVLDATTDKPIACEYRDDARFGASRGSADVGYMRARLVPGRQYTLMFSPKESEALRYQCTFSAPSSAGPVSMMTLNRTGVGS